MCIKDASLCHETSMRFTREFIQNHLPKGTARSLHVATCTSRRE